MDQHSWTALIIATARGHTDCANLLSEHMKTSKVKAAPEALPPSSGFAWTARGSNMDLHIENNSLSVPMSCDGTIFIWSNHPIPPHVETFYYEIEVLSRNRNDLCVRASATKLLDTNSSFLVCRLV